MRSFIAFLAIIAVSYGCGSVKTSSTMLVGPGNQKFNLPQKEVREKIVETMKALSYAIQKDEQAAVVAEVPKDKIPGLIFEVKFLAKKRYYMRANIKELGQKETNVRLDFFSVETGLLVEEKDSVVENSQFALFKKFFKEAEKQGLK